MSPNNHSPLPAEQLVEGSSPSGPVIFVLSHYKKKHQEPQEEQQKTKTANDISDELAELKVQVKILISQVQGLHSDVKELKSAK
jgi:hypothetical protein